MTAEDQGSDAPAPTESSLEGVAEPAEEQTMVETPPPVDPALVERMHRVQDEIAEDEYVLDDLPDPKS